MNEPRAFRDRISAKVFRFSKALRASKRLGIAVLGPALENSDDPCGTRKRHQIYDALKRDGHDPFFPEDLVVKGTPQALIEESAILRSDQVDWVILLHTKTSVGTLIEIGHFISYPEIRGKTTVVYPTDFYQPDDALAANTVRAFWSPPLLYNDHQFVSCNLVAECRELASNRLQDESTLNWPPGHLPIP